LASNSFVVYSSVWSTIRQLARNGALEVTEGVARDGLLGESRLSAYLANAAVCNTCITSEHISAIMHQAATANYLQGNFSMFSAAPSTQTS